MTEAPNGVKTGGGYGSHQPALRAFAKFMEVHSVIEFGAGLFSTHLFLDKTVFPHLASLVTFEHDGGWAEKVRVEDDRHKLIIVSHEQFVNKSMGMKADFVFLDSGPSFKTRFGLMKHAKTLAPVLAIHDCLINRFNNEGFKYVKGFNGVIQTVFASDTVNLDELRLL